MDTERILARVTRWETRSAIVREPTFFASNRATNSPSSSCMCSTSSLFCVFGRYSFTEAELKHVFPGKVWAYRCSECTRIEASNRQAEQIARSRAATLFSAAITAQLPRYS